jgi:hypothetical protein
MLITGDDPEHISHVKKYLSEQFQMSDLGSLGYFLGIEVLQSPKGYYHFQYKYIQDHVARSGISDNCRAASLQHRWIFTYNFIRMMVYLYRNHLDIVILWVALFTSLSPSRSDISDNCTFGSYFESVCSCSYFCLL